MKLKPKVKLHTDFYVFDTETGKRKNGKIVWHLNARPESFIFGVVYGHNYTKVIHSVKEFKKEFEHERYKGKKVFAHNAEYDLNVLYGNIYELDPNAIFNGKFICATNKNCMFADSMNIYKTSVKTLGHLMNLEKLGMSRNYKYSLWPKDKARDIEGCTRDCRIVWEALFQAFEDSGDIKITQASLAMTFYRRFYQPYTIEHNELTAAFWDSYTGGRCEAFKLGKTHSHVIDINSSYPNAMVKCIFPNPKYLKEEINVNVEHFINQILPNNEGCIYASIQHKKTWLGYLPVRYKGKLCFPNGTFSGCFNFNEIRYALSSKVIVIKAITRVVYSEPVESPFIDFVKKLYFKRFQSTNDFEKYRLKIYMNSLYGKFAQRINEESIYIPNMIDAYDMIREHQKKRTFIKLSVFNTDRLDAFLVIKSTKKIALSYSIPSFSSYITSYARIELLKKLLELKENKPVYCDTDSIFFELGSKAIESSNELGKWKLEKKIVTEIIGLKNYKFIDDGAEIHRVKGVPVSAIKTGPNSWEYKNLIKTKEALRRNTGPGVLTKRAKTLKNTYDKRTVLNDGETEPLILTI